MCWSVALWKLILGSAEVADPRIKIIRPKTGDGAVQWQPPAKFDLWPRLWLDARVSHLRRAGEGGAGAVVEIDRTPFRNAKIVSEVFIL
jgi:hypothetical protein